MPWYLIAKMRNGTELSVTEHVTEEAAILRANDILGHDRTALIQIEEVRGRLLRRQKIDRILVGAPNAAPDEYHVIPYDADFRAAARKWIEAHPNGVVRVGRVEWQHILTPRIELDEVTP